MPQSKKNSFNKKSSRRSRRKQRPISINKLTDILDRFSLSHFKKMKVEYCDCDIRDVLMNFVKIINREAYQSVLNKRDFSMSITKIVETVEQSYKKTVVKDKEFAKITEMYFRKLHRKNLETPDISVVLDTKILIKLLYIFNIKLSPYKILNKIKNYLNRNKVLGNLELIEKQNNLYSLYDNMIHAFATPDIIICKMADNYQDIRHKNKDKILFTRDFIRYLRCLHNLDEFDEQVLTKLHEMNNIVLSYVDKSYIHLMCLTEDINCAVKQIKRVIYNQNVEEQIIFNTYVSDAIKFSCILLIHLTEMDMRLIDEQYILYDLYNEMENNITFPDIIFCKIVDNFKNKRHKNVNEILCTRELINYLRSLHSTEQTKLDVGVIEKIDIMYSTIKSYVNKPHIHMVFLNKYLYDALGAVKKELSIGDTYRFKNEICIAVKYLCVFLMQLIEIDINVMNREFNILMYAIKILDFIDSVLIPCNQQFGEHIYKDMEALFNKFMVYYHCKATAKAKVIKAYSQVSLYIIQQQFPSEYKSSMSKYKDEKMFGMLLDKPLSLKNYENGIDTLKLVMKKIIKAFTNCKCEHKKNTLCLFKTLLSEGLQCR